MINTRTIVNGEVKIVDVNEKDIIKKLEKEGMDKVSKLFRTFLN
uniref:Uncharacterized protein n=1 Tax=viral metagenome TaxID=1070528 RepID=A0A6C0KW38_9ZZZZ